MSDTPLSETCVCGGTQWHRMLDRVIWCRRCGCVRSILERLWHVPLDRVGDLSSKVILPEGDDQPTDPGTPNAKKRESINPVDDDRGVND